MSKKKNNNITDEKILSFLEESITISDETKIIYQYTNIEALFNGIIVKEPEKIDEEICLWASHYMYLNDPSEITIGQEYLNEISNQFIFEKDNNDGKIDLLNGEDFFITSFSTTIDSLPMWSMYGKNGAGIALGFDKNIIHKERNDGLYKCVYLDKEIKDKITSFFENHKGEKTKKETQNISFPPPTTTATYNFLGELIKELFTKIGLLMRLMPIIFAKNLAYKYEDEIRLLILSDKDSEIKYRCQNNLIIPYIENFFPKKALKEIWIGPTNDREKTKKSLQAYLDYMGFSDVEIKLSEVPYRT